MDIIVVETGVKESLSLTDHRTGINWIKDLITNSGAMGTQFIKIENESIDNNNTYFVHDKDYNWWLKFIENMQKLDYRIASLSQQGLDVYPLIHDYEVTNWEDYPFVINNILDNIFGLD